MLHKQNGSAHLIYIVICSTCVRLFKQIIHTSLSNFDPSQNTPVGNNEDEAHHFLYSLSVFRFPIPQIIVDFEQIISGILEDQASNSYDKKKESSTLLPSP